MGGHDTLGERLNEIRDRIVEVKSAEWRRDPKRTFSDTANCMTRGAMGLSERASALHPQFLSLSCRC